MKKILFLILITITIADARWNQTTDTNFHSYVNNKICEYRHPQPSSSLSGYSIDSNAGTQIIKGTSGSAIFLSFARFSGSFVCLNSSTKTDNSCLFSKKINYDNSHYITCSDGIYETYPFPENTEFDPDTQEFKCKDNYADKNGTCTELPQNSDGFNEDGTPNCNTGFIGENGVCIDDPTRKDDGTCEDGFHVELNNPQCVADSSGGDTGGGDSSGGDSSGGDTGGGDSSGGDTSGGDTGGGSNGDGGSDGGSNGGGGSDGGSNGGGVGGETGDPSNGGGENPDDGSGGETGESNSCNDSSLTLTERMLCEMNENSKNIDRNLDPTKANSLSDLMKDLKDNNSTENKTISDNIVKSNAKLTNLHTDLNSLKTINQQLINGQNSTNDHLAEMTGDSDTPSLDNLNSSTDWIGNVTGNYTTFYNNLQSQGSNFSTFADSVKEKINEGFTLNLTNSDVVSCPTSYVLDLTSLGQQNINLNVDFCSQTSKLRPYLYPFILIILLVGIVFFTIRMIGAI